MLWKRASETAILKGKVNMQMIKVFTGLLFFHFKYQKKDNVIIMPK